MTSNARRKLDQPTKAARHAVEPTTLTAKDISDRNPIAELDDPSIDPAAEKAARQYLGRNCLAYVRPADRREEVEKHCRALYGFGMPLEWTASHLRNIYDPGDCNGVIKNVEEFYRRAVLLKSDISGDSDPFERFEGKTLPYFEALPELEWLWLDLIAENSLFVMYGKQKSGKTFLALNLALSIAANQREFCGRPIKWSRVLYVIAEGNDKEFAKRLKVWIDSFPKSERARIREYLKSNLKVVTCPVMVNQAEHVAALVRRNEGSWDLVVIDTYMRNTSGNVNDPKDAVLFVNGCDTIRQETGAAVLVIHHTGKDESRGAFGSMHLMGACDGAAVISKRENGERIMSIDVMRNGDDDQDDMVFKLEKVLLGITDDKEQFSCRVEFVERRPKGAKAADADDKSNPEHDILKAIQASEPDSIATLVGLVDSTRPTVFRHLKALRERGLIGRGLKLTEEGRIEAKNLLNDDGFDDMDFG